MDVQHLLEAMRSDAREIARSHPDELEQLRASSSKGDDPASAVAAYDYQAFEELLNPDQAPAGGTVDDVALAGFRELIDRYMDANAPGKPAFKDYIRTVSVYLAFIARLPLHPPGMRFVGGKEIALVEGTWRCPGKREFAGDPLSLCRYCVCRSD
jgi:uncharacterized protein (UPF0305 family)